jgi:hypothetical protein
MAPPKDVTDIFRGYEGQWDAALKRWENMCEPVLLEREKFRITGLFDGASGRPVSDDAAPRDDSDFKRYLDDLSPETRKRAFEDLTARCDKVIPELKRVLVMLQEAQHSGVWSGAPQLRVSVRSKPSYVVGQTVDHVSREERMTVLEVKGEWWRVQTMRGKEGWVNRSQVKPQLPVELKSTPGTSGDPNASDRKEVDIAGRG